MKNMAEDISNRTLAALLAVTIVVSLGGTFFVLNNPAQLSGLLVTENNQSGTVNVTLSSLISLQIVKSGIIMTNLTAGVTTVSTSGIDGGSADILVLNVTTFKVSTMALPDFAEGFGLENQIITITMTLQ